MSDQYTLLRERFMDEDAPNIESDYMITTPKKFTGKTWIYEVISKRGTMGLGEVKWFPRWRQYAFFPFSETTFSLGCLSDISKFIQLLIDEYRSSGETAK